MNRHSPMQTAFSSLAMLAAMALTSGNAYGQADSRTEPMAEEATLVGKCFARPINRVYVAMVGGRVHVDVARGKVAFVQLPESIPLKNAIFDHRGFRIDQYDNTITITPGATLSKGDAANMLIKVDPLYLSLEMTVTESKYPASILDVIPLPNDEFERRKAEEEARLEKTRHERDARVMVRYRRGMARTLLGMREEGPRLASLLRHGHQEPHYAPNGEAQGVLTRMFEADGYRYLEVVLENRTASNIQLERAYISEGVGEAIPVDVVLQEPDKTITELPSVARTRDKLRAMVVVPESIAAGMSGLRVHFYGPPGMPTIVATEVIELWPRMPEHIQRRRRWAKQISVSARVLGGGYWMGIGSDTDSTDPGVEGTGMTGLGVRVSKGIHRLFAVEGEFAGGRSGTAHFANVSWDGMTGDVTRQATFGRAQGLGVVRFGHKYLTSLRVGLGIQVADYASSMAGGGAPIDGPGDGFEVDGLWSVGAGFDARLGEHWLLGAGLTFADAFNTDARSLEFGIHAGYRWSLPGEDGSLNY